MIITQDGYDPGDNPAGVPLIGYDNKISAITASSEAAGFPANNLLNSATHLVWKATDTSRQTLGLTTSGTVNYLAIAGQNLSAIGSRIGITESANADATAGYLAVLMHFEGTNGSTDFIDSSGNDISWKVNAAGPTISTAQFKFGSASVNFTGTNYLQTQGTPTFNFATGNFTVDFWLRITATGVSYYLIDTGELANGFAINKTSGDVLVFRAASADRITGTTALTTGQWYHVAVARSGGSTKLFLNGTQEGSTYSDSNVYISNTFAHLGARADGSQGTNGFIDELRVLNGKAAWTSNFTAPTSAYTDGKTTLLGAYPLLLHFDGVDGSTTITNSGDADNVFIAVGNAQLDTAQFKFGTASLLLDGTGDYLTGDGSEEFAFGSGDFTIDFWVRFNTTASQVIMYDSRPAGTSTGPYITLLRTGADKLSLFVEGTNRITGATSITGATWHHIALTRSGTDTKLFLNGLQEGSTYTDSNIYLNAPSRPAIGVDGNGLSAFVNGWIDELRVVRGMALWTTNFAPPTHAAGSMATIGKTLELSDDAPLILRFTPTTNQIAISIPSGDAAAQIAVMYAGELLVLERSIKADVQHMDVTHARQSNVLAGMSESGNFLGRVLLSEWRESQAEFAWFTPDWYRTYFEPFVASALTEPFFWAWNPDEYPEETAFAWIIEDIRPETDPATRRMAATISMRAIA